MSKEKEKLFKKLSDAVVNMDEEETVLLSKKVVVDGYDAYEAIDKGLADGMDRRESCLRKRSISFPSF